MKRYSAFSIAREAMRYHSGWERAWRSPTPKAKYDVVIVGAGGHGLATAYYLGKNFGIKNVAIIEKGWLGGGNTGRNTTIIRSNYLQDPSAAIYEKARSLYETLSQDLNYNIMFSPRGVMMTQSGKPVPFIIMCRSPSIWLGRESASLRLFLSIDSSPSSWSNLSETAVRFRSDTAGRTALILADG